MDRRTLLKSLGTGAVLHAAAPAIVRGAEVGDVVAGEGRRPGPVRLHRNEAALGPSAGVLAAIRDASANATSRYAGAEAAALCDALAAAHRVSRDEIVLGCGSSEILRMAAAAFAHRGKNIVVPLPSFDPFTDAAVATGAEAIAVWLTSIHAHDLDAMRAKVTADTALVYVCNPNNPTGTLTGRRDLERFIERLPSTTHVLVDEAYHHYAAAAPDYVSFIDRPIGDRRVIVTRTFSAIYGLAGLRVGYAVAAPDVANRLRAQELSEGVGALASIAAAAALGDVEHVRRSARLNADARQEFVNQANARMHRTIDSHANFVMLDTVRPAAHVVEHFRTNDMLIGGPVPGFPKHVRVSIGSADDMRAFWRVWDLMPRRMTM